MIAFFPEINLILFLKDIISETIVGNLSITFYLCVKRWLFFDLDNSVLKSVTSFDIDKTI